MEIAKVMKKGRKDKLPAPINVPKKKLLEKAAKVDKHIVLQRLMNYSMQEAVLLQLDWV